MREGNKEGGSKGESGDEESLDITHLGAYKGAFPHKSLFGSPSST